MIRFLFLLFIIATSAVLGVLWLSKNSGELQFVVMDYKIETTVTVFVMALITLFVLLQVVIMLLNKIVSLPKNIKRFFREKNFTENIKHLSEFILSYATDEVSTARNHLRKLDKDLVKENVITVGEMLLDKKSTDHKAFKTRLLSLTKNKDTSATAYNELLKIAMADHDWVQAITYSNEVWKDDRNKIVAKSFFKAMLKLERWEELLSLLDKSRLVTMFSKDYSSYLSSDEHKNILMYVKYNLAMKYSHEHDNAKALSLLDKVMAALPKFTPAYELAAKINLNDRKHDQVIKVVKKAWKHNPTSMLTAMAIDCAKYINEGHVEKIYTSLKSIASINPKHYESNIILALAALESERYEIASKHISEALNGSKKQRACILMAEYCQRTHGNKTEAIRWLRDAISSESDRSSDDYYWDEDCFAITAFVCHKLSKIAY